MCAPVAHCKIQPVGKDYDDDTASTLTVVAVAVVVVM